MATRHVCVSLYYVNSRRKLFWWWWRPDTKLIILDSNPSVQQNT